MITKKSSSLEKYLQQRLAKKPLLLMTHLVAGYPSFEANWMMLEAMERAGVDLVELQLPFSEPIADGPRFVKANHDAIRGGSGWNAYFDLATRAAKRFSFRLVFMGYYNSVFRMGAERFCLRLADSGFSGFILPDLPPEEAVNLNALARQFEIDPILIMAPTNSPKRLAEIGHQAAGFVYCPARLGVTGRKTEISQDVVEFLGRCRASTSVPLGLGFGIRTADDIRAVHGLAKIAIVGTAGLDAWEEKGPDGYQLFLKSLVAATFEGDDSHEPREE